MLTQLKGTVIIKWYPVVTLTKLFLGQLVHVVEIHQPYIWLVLAAWEVVTLHYLLRVSFLLK